MVDFDYKIGTMPAQKLPLSEKTEEWRKQCVDALIGRGNQREYNGRTSRERKQTNYDLVNSIFDEKDLEYIINPYGIPTSKWQSPVKMENFNIIRNKIELLKGEESKRPFKFMAVGTAGNVLNTRMDARKKLISSYVEQSIVAGINGEEDPQKPLSEVLKEFDTTYQDIRERFANSILRYGEKKDKFADKFNKGWAHALTVAEEIYYVGIVANEPHIRVVNPIRFDYDRNPDVDEIENSQWAREERYMSFSQILDEYGTLLKDSDKDMLDQGLGYFGKMNSLSFTEYPGYGDFIEDRPYFYNNGMADPNHIPVYNCVWKSLKKIGFLTYIDEQGQVQEKIIHDESFKLTSEQKKLGWKLDWDWINEVWQGTRIGTSIYVDIKPMPNQIRSVDNPNICKLPYVGRIYNSLNSRATSLVDLAKPHQYTYIIVWYRLMLELAKAKGKKMVFDFAAIPRSMGMDVDKWMNYFDNLGIAFINSFEEGNESFARQTIGQFNQYTAIDMSISNSVVVYMDILNKLEDMVGEICGVSKQRAGQISSQETVGGVERSVIQSSMVTESLFYTHNEVKNQVLTQYIEAAKIAYMKGKKAQYILNDVERVMLDIDGDILNDSDYGVFMTNSNRDYQSLEAIKGLANLFIQKDQARISDLIALYKANSVSEAERDALAAEKAYDERTQAAQDSQQNAMLQQQQMVNEEAERQRQWQSEENQKNRDADMERETIKALGFSQDVNTNAIPDVLEIEKLRAKAEETKTKERMKDKELIANQINDDKRMKHETEMQDKELQMKQKEIASKEKIAKSKPKSPKK